MIYVTGDIHGCLGYDRIYNLNLSNKDYLIIAGDFELFWDNSEKEIEMRKRLEEKPFRILFVDGNHENFDILNSFKVDIWNGGKVHKISNNIYHLMRGQVFIIEGKKIFTFGGANSIDKAFRIKGVSWWEEELPNEKELKEGIENLDKNNWEVDYVITHCCSSKTLETVSAYCGFRNNYETNILNKYFDLIEEKLKYKHWYFGHYHNDIKEIVDKHTLLYKNIVKVEI